MVTRKSRSRNMFVALFSCLFFGFLSFFFPVTVVARSSKLVDVTVVERSSVLRIGLTFNGRPTCKPVSSGRADLLVFDFSPAVFPKVRQRLHASGQWVHNVFVAQNNRRKVRLAVSMAKKELSWLQSVMDGPNAGQTTYWFVLSNPRAPRRTVARPIRPAASQSSFVIIIDPGHGGKDPGALGKVSKEKDIVLKVSLALAKELSRWPGLKVHLTRSDDRFIRLRSRAKLADKYKADLFLSLHCNSCGRPKTRGLELYTLSRDGATDELAREVAAKENSVLGLEGAEVGVDDSKVLNHILCDMLMNETLNQSVRLAGFLGKAAKGTTGIRFRGHRKANFFVLRRVNAPSVLIELGFLSNSTEERLMKTNHFSVIASKFIAEGVRRYLSYAMMRDGEFAGQSTERYVVSKGDTLAAIAQRFDTTVSSLMRLNGLRNGDFIKVGQELNVPLDPIAELLGGASD